DEQLALVKDTGARMDECRAKLEPLMEMRRISGDRASRVAELAKYMAGQENQRPDTVEYRSAGAYAIEMWKAGLGQQEAVDRLHTYNRAAAHQTTTDTTGLIP